MRRSQGPKLVRVDSLSIYHNVSLSPLCGAANPRHCWLVCAARILTWFVNQHLEDKKGSGVNISDESQPYGYYVNLSAIRLDAAPLVLGVVLVGEHGGIVLLTRPVVNRFAKTHPRPCWNKPGARMLCLVAGARRQSGPAWTVARRPWIPRSGSRRSGCPGPVARVSPPRT